MFIVVEKGNQC